MQGKGRKGNGVLYIYCDRNECIQPIELQWKMKKGEQGKRGEERKIMDIKIRTARMIKNIMTHLGSKRMVFKPGVVCHHLLCMQPLVQCQEHISGITVCCPVTCGPGKLCC